MKRILVAVLLIMNTLYANSIKQSITKALESHPVINSSENDVQSKLENIEVAKSRLYPTVNVNTQYGNENKKQTNLNNSSVSNEDYDGGRHIEIAAKYNLFNGREDYGAIKQSKAEYYGSKYKQESIKDKLIYDVIESYLEIIRLQKILRYEKEGLTELEEYYTLAYDKAMVTGKKTELFTVNSKKLKLENSYLRNQWELKKQEERYVQLVGERPSANMSIDIFKEIEQHELPIFLKRLVVNNSELKENLSKQRGKSAQVIMTESNYYPRVDLEVKKYEDEDIESRGNKIEQTSMMVNMKLNLFNGFKDQRTIEKLNYERLKLKSDYEQKVREQKEKIISQYALYYNSKDRIDKLLDNINVQIELRDLYKEEFKLGQRTINNLVESEQDLINAYRSYVRAVMDMAKSSYAVVYYSGGLHRLIKGNKFRRISLFEQNPKEILQSMSEQRLQIAYPAVKREQEVVAVSEESIGIEKEEPQYTLSIATFSNQKNAQRFISERFKDDENIKSFKLKQYVKIIYGGYISKEEALEALAKLPEDLVESQKIRVKPFAWYSKYM